MTAEAAAWVQAIAAVVQAVFGVILIIATVVYTRDTRRIANKTDALAEQTKSSVELTERYQREQVRPTLGFRVNHREYGDRFDLFRFTITVDIINVGAGPALNTSISLEQLEGPEADWKVEPDGSDPIVDPFILPASATTRRVYRVASDPDTCWRLIATYEDVLKARFESNLLISLSNYKSIEDGYNNGIQISPLEVTEIESAVPRV
jgi:hypothetical protein